MSPQRAVVFETDRVLLMAHRFLAYPSGIELTFTVWFRHADDRRRDLLWGPPGPRSPQAITDDVLRLGVLLSDGTKWTNLDGWFLRERRVRPPVVTALGGTGGSESWNLRHWLWPLPPEGELMVFGEWPAYGVAETSVVVDATELRARAAESRTIWPN